MLGTYVIAYARKVRNPATCCSAALPPCRPAALLAVWSHAVA